jgi:hypothetical protein
MKAVLLVAVLWAGFLATVISQAQDGGTEEDRLHVQVVMLRGQLAAALKAQAKCEADGSQATQQLQMAQTEGQALIKALEARGLMVNAQNQIVPKPSAKTP